MVLIATKTVLMNVYSLCRGQKACITSTTP